MKRLLSLILAVFAVAITSASAMAEEIGTVDYEKLLRSFNKAQSYRDDLNIREQEIETTKAAFVKQIREAKQAQPNNPVAIEQLQKKLEEQLVTKVNESRNWMASQEKQLQTAMETAIQDVARQKQLDVVVAKQTVFYGGTDITNDVLARLNK